MNNLVKTSYSKEDVEILLKDLSGSMQELDTAEREHMIQSGVHYSEMLPMEHRPTDEYMKIYNESLETMSKKTAECCAKLSNILYNKHGDKLVVISLARAGIPVGILVKRYIKMVYGVDIRHYSISIIRGRGIDVNAMNYIREECGCTCGVEHFQFLDGWTGKGAISRQLTEAVNELKSNWAGWDDLSDDLAVLADPANMCVNRGTSEDFLIPSACLNSTVSGLISRTILKDDIIDTDAGDFHGAVYFKQFETEDKSIEFIDKVTGHFKEVVDNTTGPDRLKDLTGLEVVTALAKEYNISDINLIKPGVGETTRVLLRRVPWLVLIDPSNIQSDTSNSGIEHIKRLCKEKSIPIQTHKLGNYKACGIIKDLSADA